MIYREIVQQFRSNVRTKNRDYFPSKDLKTPGNPHHVWKYPSKRRKNGGLVPQETLDDEDDLTYDDD